MIAIMLKIWITGSALPPSLNTFATKVPKKAELIVSKCLKKSISAFILSAFIGDFYYLLITMNVV